MAPVKNPNNTNKITSNTVTTNNNSSTHRLSSSAVNTSNAAATNANGRKQTGTVPKTTAKATSTSNGVTIENCSNNIQYGQKSILQAPSTGVVQLANRCSPLNVVASIQQQQQQQQQQTTRSQHQQQQYFKNTEIVAPIRRDLKDLNDYLLTTVVTTANNTNNGNNTTLLQQSFSGAGTSNSDLENSQENQQRFCYPVRPIPRRNQTQSQQQAQNDYQNSTSGSSTGVVNSNLNAAIGVVIPTTPSLPLANTTTVSAISSVQPVANNSNSNAALPNELGPQFEQQLHLLVLQRLKQLFDNSQASPYLNLTASILPGIQASSSASLANTILNHNTNEIAQLAQRVQNININQSKNNLENSLATQKKDKKPARMVHEINPSTTTNEVVVNSTSLEDVALSEMSDRAQSIQSLHSNMETPTPDNTPSYEELQQRLEASNRNIQNMQDQQQQLLMLQNAAKQHLTDMERLRQQTASLSFPAGSQRAANGDDGTPEYESVEQVHSDMANLVGRMKNLTSFIQNQNELSTLLGDEGPEIRAEQEALQKKLDSLRTQRDEMRSLVDELQTINRSAEETAKEARQRQFEQEKDIEENDQEQKTVAPLNSKSKKHPSNEREVPIELSRNVPIELLQHAQRPQQTNGTDQSETDTEMDEDERRAAASLIQQKVSDIEAMKTQLRRLKDMMETVNLIESHTAKDPKLVGRTPPPPIAREVPLTYDRERTPVATTYNDDNGNAEFLARKVHMLNEVTSDLKVQAESLKAEKARIQALKDEIERRKTQAAAAVQLGDDALKRNSLTPTPMHSRTHEDRWAEHLRTQLERDQLKEEYERKKKEFQQICKRLEQEDAPTTEQQQTSRPGHDVVSEADDEAEEDNIESDYAESTKFVPTSTPAASRNNESARTGKDSLNSTGVSSNAGTHIAQAPSSTHDGASLEGASVQSGSSRSFSIPPPMSAMGISFPGPIPPPLPAAWNPHQYYYATGVPPPPPPPQTSYATMNNNATNVATTLNQSECACTSNNLGATTSSSTATSAAANTVLATDPMLQQFIQTQQMLINSVCQCNQMLWHQQREIDNLNQTIHMLQERIISLTGGNGGNADINYTLRSESVPPPSLTGVAPNAHALPNNLYMNINRAQSEQPALYMSGPPQRNGGFSNYQQQLQQQQHVFRRVSQQQQNGTANGYNFSTETQQHNSSSAASASMYTNLNNAAQSVPPPPPSTLFNNEIPQSPQSPVVASGPAPIFMHHHNNSIHQNNVNLRTQNQQQQQHHHSHSNISGSTLNNQVPPGNRANNYWDNFRSYSRQNLLSTNSTKSNEEQQQQQQHHNQESNYDRSQSLQTQTPTQIPAQSLYHEQNLNVDDCVNNLNYAANNEAASKYLRILQRSRINQQQQQQLQQNVYQQQRDFLQQLNWLELQDNTNSNTEAPPSNNAPDLMYHNYNIQQSNKVGPKPNWRFRNINEEYSLASNQLNRVQSQNQSPQTTSSLPRYQNTLSFSQQQQQAEMTGINQQHFLNPQQTHNQATRNHDFLLHPSVEVNVNVNDVDDEVNYNFLNTGHHTQQLPLDFSNPSGGQQNAIIDNMHNFPPECNENNEDEEEDEDDTTSEEIKRNLLVNALKNDKFTTKFYESIKEDVFRRLESMLLDKNNIQIQQSSVAVEAPPATSQLLNNNISNNSLRKHNLNEQRDQIQQQQQQQHRTQSPLPMQNQTFESHSHSQQQLDSQLITRNDCLTTVNGTALNDKVENEHEKPEEDTNWHQNIISNTCSANSTPKQSISSVSAPTSIIAKNCTKKRKNVRSKQSSANNNKNSANLNPVAVATNEDENNENLRGACSLAAQQHQQQQQHVNKQNDNKNVHNSNANSASLTTSTAFSSSPSSATSITTTTFVNSSQTNECDLIKYIISRIRNQTHANTLINDALLIEVAKLTATVAQNAQPFIQRNIASSNNNNISPKKIYTKIKKLTVPKERDEFLTWYQQYLENTLFGVVCPKEEASKTKTTKQVNNQQQSPCVQNGVVGGKQQLLQTIQDDGDLAEADQNCSSNTSSNYHHLEEDGIANSNSNNGGFENTQNKKEVNETDFACTLAPDNQQNEEVSLVVNGEKNGSKSEKHDFEKD